MTTSASPAPTRNRTKLILLLAVASPLVLTGVLCLGVACFTGPSLDGYTPAADDAGGDGEEERPVVAQRTDGVGQAAEGQSSSKTYANSVGSLIGGLVKELPRHVVPAGETKPPDDTPDDRPKEPPTKPKTTVATDKKPDDKKTTAGGAGMSLLGKLLPGGKNPEPGGKSPPPVTKTPPPDKKPPPDKTPAPSKNPWGEMKTAKLIDEKSRRTVTTFSVPEAWKTKSQVVPVSDGTAMYSLEAASDNDEERFAYVRFDLTAQEFAVLCREMKLNVSLEQGYYLGPEKLLSDFITPMYSQTSTDAKITSKKVENIKVADPSARAYGMELGLEYRRDKDSLRYVERTIVIVGCSPANGGRVDMMIYSLALRNTPENKTRVVTGLQQIAASRKDNP